MAVLTGQLARVSFGGLPSNPNLTAEHWAFTWINQFEPVPYASDTQRAEQTALLMHWPVEANARILQGQLQPAFVDDWYHRIHITPQQLDLGNIVSAQATTVSVWNAYLEPRTLSAVNGLNDGIQVSGQPELPLLFQPLKELAWQLTVTPDGEPVLDTIVEWQFDGEVSAGVRVTANRIIGWTFVPDWADGITERLTFATDILQSESAAEQRRSLRQAPRREFEAPMYIEGRERQMLDLALHGWGSRTWALPLWHEIQLLRVGIPVEAISIPCSTSHLDFRAGGLAMLRAETAFASETVEILDILPAALLLKRGTQQAWPVGTRLYPVRSAQLLEQPSLTRLNDQVISAEVRFLVVEACDWPAVMPSTLYRGHPVYEARPDEAEDLTHTLARLVLTLDNGSAMPLVTDTANRGLSVLAHRWVELGRAQRASLRSFIYAMAGRQKAAWVPSHADDLTLIDVVSSVGTTLDVAYCAYTRFASGKAGRRDIRIELVDGAVLFRRITGSTELSLEIERLAIDTALGRQVLPSDVARISWMVLCRFDSDTQEIEHQTDSEGVATWATAFREVPDYES